jgi:hypothetical protein
MIFSLLLACLYRACNLCWFYRVNNFMAEVCSIPYNYEGRLDSIRMEACGGRDQVVVQAYSAGWRSYEEPMPVVLLRLIGRGGCTACV